MASVVDNDPLVYNQFVISLKMTRRTGPASSRRANARRQKSYVYHRWPPPAPPMVTLDNQSFVITAGWVPARGCYGRKRCSVAVTSPPEARCHVLRGESRCAVLRRLRSGVSAHALAAQRGPLWSLAGRLPRPGRLLGTEAWPASSAFLSSVAESTAPLLFWFRGARCWGAIWAMGLSWSCRRQLR